MESAEEDLRLFDFIQRNITATEHRRTIRTNVAMIIPNPPVDIQMSSVDSSLDSTARRRGLKSRCLFAEITTIAMPHGVIQPAMGLLYM